MQATIPDNQYIYLSNISPDEEAIVEKYFQAEVPNRHYIDVTSHSWDGVYRKYHRGKRRLARPYLAMLRQLCRERNFALSVDDERDRPRYKPSIPIEDIDNTLLPGITLEPYQVNAIKKIYGCEVGMFDVPTGGGKTELIAAICKIMDCPTVILAEQTIVVEQIKQRLDLRQIADEVGLFYAGKMPTGQMVIVGTVQSLMSPKKPPSPPENIKGLPSKNIRNIVLALTNGEEYEFERDPSYKGVKYTDIGKLERKYYDKYKKYLAQSKGYKTRKKKSKILQDLIKKCEMIIVDECVHEDSYISTDSGLLRAGDIVNDLEDGKEIFAMVDNQKHLIINHKIKYSDDCYNITTSRGRSLISSSNHPFMLFNYDYGMIEKHAKDINIGDLVFTPSYDLDILEYDEKWYNTGLFIGDGHFLDDNIIRFCITKDVDDWENAVRNMTEYWGGEFSYRINERGDHNFVIISPDFCDWLRSLGFDVGRKSGNMDPKFSIPNQSAAASILRGIFDAEGSPYSDHATADMVDEPVIRFCQYLFSYIGISSGIGISNKRSKENYKTLWRVRVNGENFKKFSRIVNFNFSRKKLPNYNNKIPSNRELDIKKILNRWIKCGLKPKVLKRYLNLYNSILSPSSNNKTSMSTFIRWQKEILELCNSKITTWSDASKNFGITYDDVAKHHGMSIMAACTKIKNDIDLYSPIVDDIKSKLSFSILDIGINYAVESISNIEKIDSKQKLIDFEVNETKKFEANGILVHNCDLATNDLYRNVFRYWFKGRRRYGFSGTPYDESKPVERLLLQEVLGSVIYKIKRRKVEKANRIIPFEYYMLAMYEDGNKHDATMYDMAVDEYMVSSEIFHKAIADLCVKVRDDESDGTLILVDRDPLGHALNDLIPKSAFLHGKTPKRRRPEMLKSFEERTINVLIGGKNVRRGLDLDGGCENLIIATGGKLGSEFKQQIGRSVRHNKKGFARVWDILFLCNKYLYEHSRCRLKTVVEMGYPSQVIFKDGAVDGDKFVRSRFRKPKRLSKSIF